MTAPATRDDVTALLRRWQSGDEAALAALTPLVYDELHRLARSYLREERADHTLQPTALVNEAFLRLLGQDRIDWQARSQFVGLAAQAMRRVLVDHARRRLADKRPDPAQRLPFEFADGVPVRDEVLVALDEALADLARLDPRQAEVIELKFFGGLDTEQIAAALSISTATVGREWRLGRSWLWQALASR
jgi:RNA polymerase sigma factor (TIGR02999 family)